MREIWRLVRYVIATLILCAAGGCCHPGVDMRSFDVNVQLDDSLQNHGTMRTVEVDILGIKDSDYASWNKKKVNQYWLPNDTDRVGTNKRMLQFYSDFNPQTLSSSDPIWNEWLGGDAKAKHLFIYCFIAGVSHPEIEPDQDPWRLVLPLDKCAWDSSMTAVDLVVTLHGITCQTPWKQLDTNK